MNRQSVPRVVSADHVQPPPDRSGRRGDLHAAVPRSVQLQLRSADSAGHRDGGHGDAQPPGRGRQGRQRHAQRRQLLHLVERRPAHDHLLPQHDRHPDRDHRQPHADDAFRWCADKQLPQGDWPMPGRAAGVALPAVDRLRDHQQSRHPRPGLALPRDVPLQHLRAWARTRSRRAARLLDRHAEAHRGARSGRGGGSAAARRGAAARRPAAATAAARAPAGGGFGARALPTELYNTVLHDPKMRDPRGYIIPVRSAGFRRPRRSSSMRCSRPASRVLRATAPFQVAGKSYPAGLVRREDGAGLPAARHGHVRAAGSPERFPLSRRAARSALRHHRLDAGHPDGRPVRPHSRRLRRPVHEDRWRAAAAARRRSAGRRTRPAT